MDDAALDRIEKAIGPNMHINRYFSIRKTDQEDRDALAQLRREHAELTAEVNRLNTLHTLSACANNCGRGVRSRHAVHGMCPTCAEAEIDRLNNTLDAIRSVIRSTVDSLGNGHLLPEELVREAGQ
jgi:predicted RNA-binding Zn-ribbon protein involved in translation (DUF1610 family)